MSLLVEAVARESRWVAVMYASPAAGIKRVEDLAKAKNLIYGGISAIGLDLIPLISFELLEMDAKGVLGFRVGERRGLPLSGGNQHRLPDDSCL